MSRHKHALEEPRLLWLWSPLRARLVAPSHPILQHNNFQRFNLQSHSRKNRSRALKSTLTTAFLSNYGNYFFNHIKFLVKSV